MFLSKVSDSPKTKVPIEIFDFENLNNAAPLLNINSKSFDG